MAEGFSWSEARNGSGYRLPGPERLGWWATVAMALSILLHIIVFLVLGHMKLTLRMQEPREITTGNVNVQRVEVQQMDTPEAPPPEKVITPPQDTSKLLEEVDLLAALPKDQPIDIKPEIDKAEYALRMEKPAAKGDPSAIAMQVSAGMEMEADLPEFGRKPEHLKPSEVGQVTVDPGAAQVDDNHLGKFTEDLVKRGANGKAEKGTLDGVTSLDNMLDLPPNILLAKKTMLPSDLLFEFNKSELRESAKVGLMKLALLMDRNPNLYCWIEGHTDMVGGDEFNLNLSVRRAEAVKNYLVKSLRMDAAKISTRGFGRYQPVVITGSHEEQAINRRVEIRMRKGPPSKEQLKITPPKASVIEDPPAPKAVLVKPKRALPLEDQDPPSAEPAPPRATIPTEDPASDSVPKATPVEETPPAPPPRAEPVR